MTTVVTISSKAGPLTYSELDANFNNLNNDKIERTLAVGDTLPALKITQSGAGQALIVEDQASDLTPFVIDANGNVVAGYTGQIGTNDKFGVVNGYSSQYTYSNSTSFTKKFNRSKSATIGAHTAVANNDVLGGVVFQGSDGSNFVGGAQILSYVDNSVSANSMPSRLDFSTSSSGSGTPTTRMVIDSNGNTTLTGNLLVNSNNSNPSLTISQLGSGNALTIYDEAGDTTPLYVDSNGDLYSTGSGKFGNTLIANNSIELNNSTLIDSHSILDFHSTASVDYSARILRQAGTNGSLDFTQSGTGLINFNTSSAVKFNSNINVSGTIISTGPVLAPGALVQIVGKTISTQSSQTIPASGVDTQVGTGSDFILSITPKRTGSYIKITIRMFGESTSTWDLIYNIQKDGIRINTASSANYHGIGMATLTYGNAADANSTPEILNIITLDKSGTIAGTPISYKLVVSSSCLTALTLWVNRCFGAPATFFETGISEIILEEIAQ